MAKSASRLTQGNYTAGGTTANTASISPAANSAVIVFVWGADTTTMSISGGGVSWTTAVNGAVVEGGSRFWVFSAAGSPTSGALTLTFDNDAFVNWAVDNITGTVSLSTPTNANVATATATSAAPAVTLGSFAHASNGTIAYTLVADSATITEGSGFTMTAADNQGAVFGWSQASEFRDSNDTSADFSLSGSAAWSAVALEIVDSGAGGGTGLEIPRNIRCLAAVNRAANF